jgi:hypothetical protein
MASVSFLVNREGCGARRSVGRSTEFRLTPAMP